MNGNARMHVVRPARQASEHREGVLLRGGLAERLAPKLNERVRGDDDSLGRRLCDRLALSHRQEANAVTGMHIAGERFINVEALDLKLLAYPAEQLTSPRRARRKDNSLSIKLHTEAPFFFSFYISINIPRPFVKI